jgi:hypothetical protein
MLIISNPSDILSSFEKDTYLTHLEYNYDGFSYKLIDEIFQLKKANNSFKHKVQ